jgi:predicted SprT family Zn-dependent metalloprotease
MSSVVESFTVDQKTVLKQSIQWMGFYQNKLSIKPRIRVNFSGRMTHTAGIVEKSGDIWYITYSNNFLKERSFEQTVVHEISHIYANEYFNDNCGHDSRWRHIMNKSGFPAIRCHSYETPPRKRRKTTLKYKCLVCSTEFCIGINVQEKIIEGHIYRCGQCKTQVIF